LRLLFHQQQPQPQQQPQQQQQQQPRQQHQQARAAISLKRFVLDAMGWEWEINRIVCDICTEPIYPKSHPGSSWNECQAKHVAYLAKVSEIKHNRRTVGWVCMGCAYTAEAVTKYSESAVYDFTQLYTWERLCPNQMPCRDCSIWAEAHITEHLPKVVRQLRRLNRPSAAFALQKLRERDPDKAEELDSETVEPEEPEMQPAMGAPRVPTGAPPHPPQPPPGLRQQQQQPPQHALPSSSQTPSDQLIANCLETIEDLKHAKDKADVEIRKVKERLAKVATRQQEGRPVTFGSWESMYDYAPTPQEPEQPSAGGTPEEHNMNGSQSDVISQLSGWSAEGFCKADHDASWQFQQPK
jgi:hypothetical protein